MNDQRITTLITDIDNTLFDWVEQWYKSFSVMLKKISEISGLPEEILIPEIKKVHETHGTSEYAFLIGEIPALQKLHPNHSLEEVYLEAITAYREARRAHLRLFPTVLSTLTTLKNQGVQIVAYTDSMSYYTLDRIREFGLDGIIDYLYSPPDHEMPDEQIRSYSHEHYDLSDTIHRHTPANKTKPNPQVLKQILSDLEARNFNTIYIGDSLMKDIAMAQQAQVHDVYAAYGVAIDRPEYDLLRQVTHWTGQEVKEEVSIEITPTLTVQNSFSEILELFQFAAFHQ